jgi:CRP/FNR family transcriptional activator FtrB
MLAGVRESTFGRIIAPSYLQRFPAGTTLIEEGAPVDSLFILLQGSVAMSAASGDNETVLEVLEPVNLFILAAVLNDEVSLQTARTLKTSRVLMIPASLVRELMAEDIGFMQAVVFELSNAYRRTIRELKNQKLRSCTERLAGWLVAESARQSAASFTIPFEKRVLAALLGMSPENLSRGFNSLAAHGATIKGNVVELESIEAIEGFAQPTTAIDNANSRSAAQ